MSAQAVGRRPGGRPGPGDDISYYSEETAAIAGEPAREGHAEP